MVLSDLISDYGTTPKSKEPMGFVTLDPDEHKPYQTCNAESVEKARKHEDTPGFKRKSIDTNRETSLQRSSGLQVNTGSPSVPKNPDTKKAKPEPLTKTTTWSSQQTAATASDTPTLPSFPIQ